MEFRVTLLVLTLGLPFLSVNGQTTQTRCAQNMNYNKCGTACPLSCDNYRQPPVCTKDCKEGCFCNDGFVQLRDGSSICVDKNQCPVCKAFQTRCNLVAPISVSQLITVLEWRFSLQITSPEKAVKKVVRSCR